MKTVRQKLIAICGVVVLAGCGTPKEKSAPCKRPANLMSYAATDVRLSCGPMQAVNADKVAAWALIGDLPYRPE
ncbi:MAG: hypothetical protein EOR16_23180 [Mesorhizobium sp.]|uniref:hypothetical protein n=1 Tax=Mesorhizobium sp. TaxID=1871066 RepID=UPI000FE6D94E|nr:hypothetical protein [Mesorhizobium sp.]RWI54702.1 MAG: hypothetical protein EOR16_23180 [Mesorhizobium sp.]